MRPPGGIYKYMSYTDLYLSYTVIGGFHTLCSAFQHLHGAPTAHPRRVHPHLSLGTPYLPLRSDEVHVAIMPLHTGHRPPMGS